MHTLQAAQEFLAHVQPTVPAQHQAIFADFIGTPAHALWAYAYGVLVSAGNVCAGETEFVGTDLPSCVAVAIWEFCAA